MVEIKGGHGYQGEGEELEGGHLRKRGCSTKSPCGGLSLSELSGVGKRIDI